VKNNFNQALNAILISSYEACWTNYRP